MSKSVFVRGLFGLFGVAVVLALPAPAKAQGQLSSKEELGRLYDASDARLREIFSGNGDPSGPADKKHADAIAKWFLYRLTIKQLMTPTPTLRDPLGKLQGDFHGKITDLMDPRNGENKREFRKLFAAALVENMKHVLHGRDLKSDPSTVIWALEMLPEMARLNDDAVFAYVCELAKDDAKPVVQLHAFKALKLAMPIAIQQHPEDPQKFELLNIYNTRKKSDLRNVEVLQKFIERPFDTKGMGPDEINAIRFIRREAISSLAQAGSPAVAAIVLPKQKAQPPQGAVAHTLANVAAGNLQPSPSLQEKVEAALGLCGMKYPQMPEYEPQVAIYLVGKTLDEFVSDYQRDWDNFAAVGAGKKLPYVPYLVDAKRLKAGLKEMATNTPPPHQKAAKELEARAEPILSVIEAKYGNVPVGAVNDLRKQVQASQPKNGYIFKTLKMQEIPLGK